MLSCFIQLNANQTPILIQRFDSAPGIEIAVPPNTLYIEDCSNYPSDTEILDHWRMKNGVLTDVGPNPGSSYRWDLVSEAWIPDLEKAKTNKLKELKAARDKKESGGFTWNNNIFDSDPISQVRIQGAVALAQTSISSNGNFEIDWTLKDNTVLPLSAADMVQVGLSLANHIISIHSTYRNLKQQVENASTIETVDAISWS